MSNHMWYFQDPITKGRRGPVKTEELKLLQSSDEVNSKTLVWTKGMKNWSYLEKVFPSSPSQLPKNANSSGADRNFYYLGKNEETLGPFSTEDLSKLLRRGEIMSSTMLWTPDQKEYITLSTALPHLLPRSHADFPNNQIQSETRFGSRQESSVPSTSKAVKDEGHENTLTFTSDEQTFSPTQDENLFMGRPATRLENVNSELQGEVLSQAESSKDYDASLEKRVLKLQLELASANAELSHTKDVMQAERNKEPQEIVTISDTFSKLAAMHESHSKSLGYRQRLLEQFCIALDIDSQAF